MDFDVITLPCCLDIDHKTPPKRVMTLWPKHQSCRPSLFWIRDYGGWNDGSWLRVSCHRSCVLNLEKILLKVGHVQKMSSLKVRVYWAKWWASISRLSQFCRHLWKRIVTSSNVAIKSRAFDAGEGSSSMLSWYICNIKNTIRYNAGGRNKDRKGDGDEGREELHLKTR